MNRSNLAAILLAGAALALSPAPAAAQEPPRASLGVRIEVQQADEQPVVAEILPGRTAAAIGFQVGDVLVEAGGRPISREVLEDYWGRVRPGDPVVFKVRRAGAVVELSGTALAAPAGEPAQPRT